MRSPLVLLIPAALVAAAVFAAASLESACGSCGACPESTVLVTATANVNLDITNLGWDGPACPDTFPTCRGDDVTTNCTHMTITGRGPGQCQLGIQFGSGLVQVVTMEWGPAEKSCCGFPVIGETTFYIASGKDAGVTGVDGASDAVRTLSTDGGAGDGAEDAAAGDAGSDASATSSASEAGP